MIRVFSTNRAVRDFYALYKDKNRLLPKAITIAEFESKAIVVKNRKFIDNDTRVLLLREATDFQEFKRLQFSSEFMTFLTHSEYIFRFFDELSSEKIEIENLKLYDMYAQYDEHLEALEILKYRYLLLLDKYNYIDKSNISKHYKLNEDYLKSLDSIELQVDGFLSRFEIDLFEKCSKIIPFYIKFELNNYNKKTKSTFQRYGFDLENDTQYTLNLSDKSISTCRAMKKDTLNVDVKVFHSRLSQIGSIFSTIAEYIQSGMEPEDIVLVLPDESLAPFLKEFDRYNNLNFAMGFSLKDTKLYKKIEAIELYFSLKKDEEKVRIKRLGIAKELLVHIQEQYRNRLDSDESIKIIQDILDLDEKESEKKELKEEIFRFSKFIHNLKELTLEQIFRLFLKRLKDKSCDDTRGGKITVMGLLETRGSNFTGVIVPDFSDDFVPKRSQKDLFLNTQIRKDVGLPTKEDRENLQKYYYYKLFKNAKKTSICTVANDNVMPSRFLDELRLKIDTKSDTSVFDSLLFDKNKVFIPKPQIVENIAYDLKQTPLSATKLDTLLTCRRKFYFRYIKRILEPKNPITQSNALYGLKIHKALESVFSKDMIIDDEKRVLNQLRDELIQKETKDIEEFELETWLVLLKNFVSLEKKRYLDGFRIFETELELTCKFEGFDLKGKLDRLDVKDSKYFVIDYKSGDTNKLLKQKVENMTNFQLPFYYLLASRFGDVQSVFYYDLKAGELKEDFNLEEKIQKLKSILKIFKEPIKTFDMCENHANCRYCPYKKLCLRED